MTALAAKEEAPESLPAPERSDPNFEGNEPPMPTIVPAITVETTACIGDEDATIFLERVVEPDGEVVVLLWGTETHSPEHRRAYVMATEANFIEFLADSGYVVTAASGAEK